MQCPYCISEISERALACPQCTRDLYLFKPLLEGKAALEKLVASQDARIIGLEARIGELEQRPLAADARYAGAISIDIVESAPEPEPEPANARHMLASCAVVLGVSLVLLLLTHWVMLFIYDAKPLYLRLATLALPIPFGMMLVWRHPRKLVWSAAAAILLGITAVLGMLAVTSAIDKVALLPQTVRDWREAFEYAVGMGLAFFTGSLIAHANHAARVLRERKPPKVMVVVAKAFKTDEKGEMAIEQLAKRIQKLVNTATPAISGATAFYAGIKGFLGEG